MTHVDPLRALLFVEALLACLLYAQLIGLLWVGRGWAIRITLIGTAGLLVYITSGQIKAVQLDVPFDAYAWVGLVSMTVLDVGLSWMWEQRRHERG